MDYKVHGILQDRLLEWVAFAFSRGSSQPRDRTQVSRIADSWATREDYYTEISITLENIVYKNRHSYIYSFIHSYSQI